jgi:V-type H+-transporting ATPase proteolipid subunit
MTVEPALLTGLGAAFSIFLSALGSAIASAEAGVYALRSTSGVFSFVPIIISGVLAIYGIIISVLLSGKLHEADVSISEAEGYRYLCSGLSVGLACAASGLGMARFIKETTNGSAMVSRSGSSSAPESAPLLVNNVSGSAMTVPPCGKRYMLVMVFLEAIALYGLIVALFLIGK